MVDFVSVDAQSLAIGMLLRGRQNCFHGNTLVERWMEWFSGGGTLAGGCRVEDQKKTRPRVQHGALHVSAEKQVLYDREREMFYTRTEM